MVPGHTWGQRGPHSAAQASILSSHLLTLFPPQAPLPGLGEQSLTQNIPPRRLIHLGPGQGLKGSEPRGSLRRDPPLTAATGVAMRSCLLSPWDTAGGPGPQVLSAGSWMDW